MFTKSRKSLVIQVCKDYENNKISIPILCKKYYLSETTIRRYLKIGTKIKICSYIPNRDGKKKSNLVAVIVYDKNHKKIGEFSSIAECSRWFLETKNKKILSSSISEVCQGKRKTAGGYIFKYKKEIKYG